VLSCNERSHLRFISLDSVQVVNSYDVIRVKVRLFVISYYKHLNLCLVQLHTVKATVNYFVSMLVNLLALWL